MNASTAADHVITVTNLDDNPDRYRRPVRVTCSCGEYSDDTSAVMSQAAGKAHVDRVTRPTVARAWQIIDALGDSLLLGDKAPLTYDEVRALQLALLAATDVADGIDPARAGKHALDRLVELLRGAA